MSAVGHEELAQTKILANGWREDVRTCMRDFGTASKACMEARDFHSCMQRLVETTHALKVLATHIGEIEDKAREYLRSTLESTGAFPMQADGLVATLADPVRQAVITDEKLVPAEFFAPPKLDRTLIAKQLRAGERIPGAELSNGGSLVLRISPRANKQQEAAAA